MAKRLSLMEKDRVYGVSIIQQNSVVETYPSHCHDFYEIFLITSGKGLHCVGDQRLLLEKGSLVLMRPDDVHSFSAFNYFDFAVCSVGFSVEEMRRALAYMDLPEERATAPELPLHMVLHGQARAGLEQDLDVLLQLRPEKRLPQFRMLLPGVLHRLLSDADARQAPEVFPTWLSRLDEEMSVQANYIQGLPRMQALCPYSQAYMNRMFKRYMKITPTEYINIKRMRYATQLLLEKKYDITEICYMSGFNNLSYFYSVFRRLYRCTPRAFVAREQ